MTNPANKKAQNVSHIEQTFPPRLYGREPNFVGHPCKVSFDTHEWISLAEHEALVEQAVKAAKAETKRLASEILRLRALVDNPAFLLEREPAETTRGEE